MKGFYIICFTLIGATLLGQIRLSDEFKPELENELEFQDAEAVPTTGVEKFDSISLGFKTFNLNLLSPFLTKGLQSEVAKIQKVFDEYTELFNKYEYTSFENRIEDGFSVSGTMGIARFRSSNRKAGTLEFMYTYNGKRPVISQILVNNDGIKYEFPLLNKSIKNVVTEIKELKKRGDNEMIVNKYEDLVLMTSNLEDYYYNPNYGLTRKSNYHGNLSWYLLLTNNPKEAIKHAKKGLEIWNANMWINTNLALGYALNGNVDKARDLYSKMGNFWYKNGKYYKDVFLEDLRHLKSINIKVPNYNTYIELLENL